MGDRANIVMRQNGGVETNIYFYSHYNGSKLPSILQDALKRQKRWDDEQYLARIIFCQMAKDDVMGELGLGISSYVGDGEDRLVEVDCEPQRVFCGNKSWSFKEYVGLEFPEENYDDWKVLANL